MEKRIVSGIMLTLLLTSMLTLAFNIQPAKAGSFTSANGVTGTTYVEGNITVDSTWTAAGSPYIVTGNILIENGVILTIEPRVVVKFNSAKAIQIDGQLIARGTETDPILFTSNHPSPVAGHWAGIKFTNSSIDASYDEAGNYLSGSIMQYCTIEYGGGGSLALKIESASPLIDNCVIKNNNSPGIHISGGSPKITNSTIVNNSISISDNNYGGGIYASGEGTMIIGNTIANNSILTVSIGFYHYKAYGGGIYASGRITVHDNVITNNSALGWGNSYGGGIYALGAVTISNNIITDNRASKGDTYGGGIYASTAVTIKNNIIANNSASSLDRYGGGIYALGAVTISGNIIIKNSVSGGTSAGWTYAYGGGVYASGDGIVVNGNSISYNSALNSYGYGCGGGIYTSGSEVNITGNSITNNRVSGRDAYAWRRFAARGGGVYASGGVTLNENIIAYNSADSTSDGGYTVDASGGGIYAYGTVAISSNKIANNFALDGGGGIYGGESVTDNSIINNLASEGGGMYGSATIAINTIIGNRISRGEGKGGGFCISSQSSINYNNIYGSTPYDVYNSNPQSSPDVDATNNWWGTIIDAQIQESIYDWFDDASLGIVDYIPYLSTPEINAPISPPTGLNATAEDSVIKLSWSANPETDLAGYRVYYDIDSGYPYDGTGANEGSSGIDVGNVTNYQLSGLRNGITYYIAITAYDSSGDEGWYSNEVILTIIVPDFSITASPTSLTIQQGNSNTSVITIASMVGFIQPVQLTVSGASSGVTATLNPEQITPPPDSSATSTLTVLVTTTAPPGSYTFSVVGTSDTQTHSTDISLEITSPPLGLAESPWPMYGHDAQRTGRSPYFGPNLPVLKWNLDVGVTVQYCAPIVIGIDGTIYVGAGSEVLVIDPESAHLGILWQAENSKVFSVAIGSDGSIYVGASYHVGTAQEHGIVHALKPDGTEKWSYPVAGIIYNSLAIGADDTIYVLPHHGPLYAISSDGGLVWMKEIAGSYAGVAIGPDGTIFAGAYYGLHAYNPNGTEVWHSTLYPDGQLVIGDDGTIYVVGYEGGSTERTLYALNPNGSVKWKKPKEPGRYPTRSPAIGWDGTIYMLYPVPYSWESGSKVDAHVVAIYPDDGSEKWSVYAQVWGFYPPVVDGNGVIYVGTSDGIYALNHDGGFKWSYKVEGYPITIDVHGTIYLWDGGLSSIGAPLPINQPPTCSIELRKDGVELDEIDVGEFFDVYVGYSIDDSGIVQVRFSSDDLQDGNPTGQWTDWYDWDTSLGDWNAETKIKRWAFATGGNKEVWAEVKDDAGQTAECSVNIVANLPDYALAVITTPVTILSSSPYYPYRGGDRLKATFGIANRRDVPITFDVLVVGGRDPDGEVVDFDKIYDITLDPAESYDYQGFLTLPGKPGIYYFFCAYYIENPSEEEKKSVDENNWNTNIAIELDGRLLSDYEAKKYRERIITVVEKAEYISTPPPRLWEEIHGPWEEDLGNMEYQIGQVVIDPSDSETIYVLVKYSKPSALNAFYYMPVRDDIFKFSNGEWEKIDDGLPSLGINVIAVAPSNPDILYIGSGRGVYKSANGGETWESLDGPKIGWWIFKHPATVLSIAVDPTDPNTIYVGTEGDGFWKKIGGENWKKISKSYSTAHIIKISPRNPNVIYASAFSVNQIGFVASEGVLRSEDGGFSWKSKWTKGIVTDIVSTGEDKEVVFVSTASYPTNIPLAGITVSTVITVPVFADTILRYDGEGDWSLRESWSEVTGKNGKNPLPVASYLSLAINPDFPSMVFAVVAGKGVYYSINSGDDWFALGLKSWSDADAEGKHITAIVLGSGTDSSILYAYGPKCLLKLRLSNTAIIVREYSTGELRVYDSQGNVTGLVNGEIREEISNSLYDDEGRTIIIFHPTDSYRYEVVGTGDESYSLRVTNITEQEITTFTAIDIPTSLGATHQYTIHWDVLSTDEEGVTVKVDSNGDGAFEKTFNADNELTQDEFMLQVSPVEAFPLWIVGVAVVTIALVTAAIVVFWRKRRQFPIEN